MRSIQNHPFCFHAPRTGQRRGLSQLQLALLAGTTPRHLSFLETCRSRPGRDLVLRLGETLDLPLREWNLLLLACAGLPPTPGVL